MEGICNGRIVQSGGNQQHYGIRGEVKVYPTTDNVRRFDDLKENTDTGKEQLNLHVTSVNISKTWLF